MFYGGSHAFLTCRNPMCETLRIMANSDCLSETNVRKPSLKELARQVIERHSAQGVAEALEARIRAMADRWRYSREELGDALIYAATEPDGALAWVEHDEGVPSPPLSPDQESARAEVLAQLEANPSVLRTFVNRFEPDGTCVVTLAIRGVGFVELKIP